MPANNNASFGFAPTGDHFRYWRRQRYTIDGRVQFIAPIYVLDTRTDRAHWYMENGAWSSNSRIDVERVLEQGGVELRDCPWDTALPEGF